MVIIKEQINNDIKDAMRAKNEMNLSVLRMLLGSLRNKEITLRTEGSAVELSDEQAMEVIMSEVKKRNDSVTSYLAGGRNDLADKENAEIKILEKYLPAQLSEEEIAQEVADVVAAMGGANVGDFGKVMGQAMARLKGRADGNKVGEAVKKLLAK